MLFGISHFALWGAQIAGKVCLINYLLQSDHIAALLVASKAKVVVALGLNDELNLCPTVEKVLALQPLHCSKSVWLARRRRAYPYSKIC